MPNALTTRRRAASRKVAANPVLALICALGVFAACGAAAQTGAAAKAVYRCGNSYSQAPCPEGQAIDVDDARSPAQKAAADASTRALAVSVRKNEEEEARLAKAQAQARAAAAKKAKATAQARRGADPSQAGGVKPRPKKHPKPLVDADPMFTAAGPQAQKPKKVVAKADEAASP